MPIADYRQNHSSLAALLSDHTLCVPPYQRNYSWGDEEVLDFWHDARDFFAELSEDRTRPGNYLFGTVVLAGRGDHAEIVDGQQRLATATILFACARNKLHAMESPYAKMLQDKYVSLVHSANTTEAEYRLTLNDEDKDFFRRYIQEFPAASLAERVRKSNGRLRRAREILETELETWLNQLPPEANKAHLLYTFAEDVAKRFSFVVITTSDIHSGAFIFEVLNDRGSKLTVADLLKNLLMTRAEKKSHREAILDAWRKLDGSRLPAEVVIRTSWASRNGDVKRRALYKEIKDSLVRGGDESLRLARALSDDAGRLRQIDEANTKNEELDDVLKDLRDLGVKSHYAMILAAMNAKPDQTFCFAKACLALAVRHLVVCGGSPTDFETAMLRAAAAMHSRDGSQTALVVLRSFSPTDETFSAKFRQLAFPKGAKKARVLLRHFEMMLGTGETEPTRVRRNLHVEHILPLKPQGRTSRRHELIVHRLGNLTLVAKEINLRVRNASIARKRTEYRLSDVKMTQSLAKYPGRLWQESAVVHRQRELERQALRLWPRQLVSDEDLKTTSRPTARSKKTKSGDQTEMFD